jgi:tRNA-Thr(GGU) m(6)t(6)A37 methyltransferase TsaA
MTELSSKRTDYIHRSIEVDYSMKNFMVIFIMTMLAGCSTTVPDNQKHIPANQFTLYPIGKVVKDDNRTWIVIDKKYQPGLLGLENYSHITVVYWFDRNDTPQKRAILQVYPRGDKSNPLTGVFGTHAPVRPNLIAISRCKILAVKENTIEVEEIDALSNSPVLDLKGDFFLYHKRKP